MNYIQTEAYFITSILSFLTYQLNVSIYIIFLRFSLYLSYYSNSDELHLIAVFLSHVLLVVNILPSPLFIVVECCTFHTVFVVIPVCSFRFYSHNHFRFEFMSCTSHIHYGLFR